MNYCYHTEIFDNKGHANYEISYFPLDNSSSSLIGSIHLKKIHLTTGSKKIISGVFLLVAILLLSMTGNCLAAAFVRIKMYPEHVGVFTTVRKQQFVAFGYMPDGSAVNITKWVDWKSSDNSIVTIDEQGLATVVAGKTFGQVKITCSFPKTPKTLTQPVSLLGPYILLTKKDPAPSKPPPPKVLSNLYLLLLGK